MRCLQLCRFVSRVCITFHWSPRLFSWKQHVGFFALAVWYSLRPGNTMPIATLLCLGWLWLPMSFCISLPPVLEDCIKHRLFLQSQYLIVSIYLSFARCPPQVFCKNLDFTTETIMTGNSNFFLIKFIPSVYKSYSVY